jgi:hypothetical protein
MTKIVANCNALIPLLVLALTLSSVSFSVEISWADHRDSRMDNNALPFNLEYNPSKHNIHKTGQLSEDDTTESPTTGTPLESLKPVAEPGWLQSVKGNDVVELDGGTSFDPNNSALTYAWTQVMGPNVVLDNDLSKNPKFTAPKTSTDASLTFQLIVSNEYGIASDPDYVTVFVN